MIPPLLLRLFSSRATRLLAVALLIFGWAYYRGRDDCGDKHRRKAAQEAAEWAEKIRVSEAEAYTRGLQAATREGQNEKIVETVGREAEKEPGAGDVCLSADTIERLRDLE